MPKGEKSKIVLMRSVQHFNNFIIKSSKKDCMNTFLHKALTDGKLNSAHSELNSVRRAQKVSVLTCSHSLASPSSEMHRVQFHPLNIYCR